MARLVTIPNVELLAVGHWEFSSGDEFASGDVTFTRQDLRDAVEAAKCPALGRPVIKIGHDRRFTQDGEPAVGQVANLRTDASGDRLLGDLVNVPAWLADVAASAYPNRSPEVRQNYRCQVGHRHPTAITGVALLGVDAPAIPLNGLGDLEKMFASWKETTVTDDNSEKIIEHAVRRGVVSASRADDYRQAARRGEDVSILNQMGALDPEVARIIGMGTVAAAGPVYRQSAPAGADPGLFSPNPLYDEVRQNRPALVAAAEADDPNAPRLFGDRDLPPFTASGLDPSILASLPWPLRRPVAAMPTLTAAYNLIEKYAGEAEQTRELITDRQNSDYLERFSLWLQGPGYPESNASPPQGHGDHMVERLHNEIFGPLG